MDPPLVTAQSPLHEMIIGELTVLLPSEVSRELQRAASVSQAHDWIAAAAIYSWIADKPALARQFLAELKSQPRTAVMALAKTLARTLEPIPPDSDTVLHDRRSALIQAAGAVAIVLARCLLFFILYIYAARSPWSWELLRHTMNVVPEVIWLSDFQTTLAVVAWLFVESFCLIPRFVDYRKRFLDDSAVNIRNWQLDSLLPFWQLHVSIIQMLAVVRLLHLAIQSNYTSPIRVSHAIVAGVCVIAACAICAATIREAAIRRPVTTVPPRKRIARPSNPRFR
ncbi:MAG: hypothetical protein HYV60_22435 [Planctomycetia bacterium]|nr:hypothetical protein [Planctomycetia bacterium]